MEKIKAVLKFGLVVLLITAVMATASASIYTEMEEKVDEYNSVVDKYSLLGWLGLEQRISCTVYLTDILYDYGNGEGVELIGIETDRSGKVVKIQEGGIGDTTVYATTTDDTIRGIMQADAPFKAFCTAVNGNWMQLKGDGFWSRREVSVVKAVAKAYGN